MIGGTIAHRIDPTILTRLGRSRRSVIVTGTNGKSTTTAMVAAAARLAGTVATNANGDNMDAGVLTALMNGSGEIAVLEVDEMHVGGIARAIEPDVIVLLNLSRDQLDRVGEIGTVEAHLRGVVDAHPHATIIANCDDPLIASAAWDAPHVVWVGAGTSWTHDAVSFPRGGHTVVFGEDGWRVPGTSYARPRPDYEVTDEGLVTPTETLPLRLSIPGRANRGNAAQAALAAHALGVDLAQALAAAGKVNAVAGRYATVPVAGRSVHMLLAKNPAGWQEALTMLDVGADTIIVDVNGQEADSTDLSWLWDVDFEQFRRQTEHIPLIATGERGLDLAVRLTYAGCRVTHAPDILTAVRQAPGTRIELLANYTAFRDAKKIFATEEAQR